MQKNVTLNPSYTGPGVIEEYVRKVKSQASLGRMISTFNKRYLVLDLTRLVFYYLPEKGSHVSNAADVPLDSITRVYVDGQLQLIGGEGVHANSNMWKHAFVVVTRKRVYRLITHSNVVLDRYLYGFANIINTETGRPLYDWSTHQKQISEPISPLPNMTAYKKVNANANDFSPSGQSPAVNQNQYKDDSSQRKDTESSPVDKKQRRYSYSIQQRQETEKRSEAPGLEKKGEVTLQHENNTKESHSESLPQVKDSMMFRGNTYGKTTAGTAGNDSEIRQQQYSNNRMTSMDESPHIIDHQSNIKLEQRDDRRQHVDPIKAKVEIVSLDEPEREVIDRARDHRRSNSVRRNSSAQRDRDQGSASRTAVQARKNESEIGFMGFNQVDLAQYQKKKTSSHIWDEDHLDKSGSKMSLVRQKTKEYPERKMNIGNGIQVSFPKFEDISGKQDLPASYISMMQEAKKFSPIIRDERGREEVGPVRSGNGVSVSVVKANDEDDWDKEMFGDEEDKGQLGKSAGKGINKDYSSNTLTGYQDPRLSQVKKQLDHKKSEIMASREEAYNDWDDDM